ncbi:hypothetical protein CRENBAI_000850 [Crenichthys baileyi]|uniref:Secreted protein n=1 Tax=Crenichthys baileyi TaxID=28760 RepID=A0AAV9RKV8_9TELE
MMQRLTLLKLLIWQATNLNHSSSSSGVAAETWAGVSEDGMGRAASSLGDGAVADEDVGILAAALMSVGTDPPPRRSNNRKSLCWRIRVRNKGSRRTTALNRLTLHLLQQQWRGQNLQIGWQMSHRLLHLLLNPAITGALLLTVCEVKFWQKHSVTTGMGEDPRRQTSRKHHGVAS